VKIEGILPAMITPMDAKGELNLEVLRNFVDHLINNGVHGIVTTGTTGEFPYLSVDERKKVLENVIAHSKNRPIIACTGHTDLRIVQELTAHAYDCGAKAVLIPAPYYMKVNEKGILEFFTKIKSKTQIDIFYYNIPQLTGNCVSPEFLAKMTKEGIISGLKDTSGDFLFFQKAFKLCKSEDKNFTVLIGEGRLTYAALCLGAEGAILGSANIVPRKMVKLYKCFREGDYENARRLQLWAYPIIESMFIGTFPAAVKEAVKILGFNVGAPRIPLSPLNNEEKKMLEELLAEKISNVGER